MNLTHPDLKIRVFGLFHPFPTPETPLEQIQPVSPNAPHPEEGQELGIVGIRRLRAELLAGDMARGVLKSVIFKDFRHFRPPRPILGAPN